MKIDDVTRWKIDELMDMNGMVETPMIAPDSWLETYT